MNKIFINAGLATLAAACGAVAISTDLLPPGWAEIPAVALLYGAVRIGAGYLAVSLKKTIPVDE